MKTIFPACTQHARLAELTHDQWIEERKRGVGGSDAAAILGMSPWRSAFDIYLDKIGEIPPSEDNLAMRIGRELEETVARLFCEETGKEVRRCGFMYQSSTRTWQLADIDRAIVGENAGLECKTTSSLGILRTLKDGDFPDTYYAQCVHYMAVTGADRWYLAVLELGFSKRFHVFRIERDEAEIDALTEAESAFWRGNVLALKPPAPDGSERTGEYISEQYPTDDGSLAGLHGHEDDLAEYLDIKAQIKALEKRAAAIEQEIKLELGEAAEGAANGYTVTWGTYTRAGGIDAKKLASEFPEAYEACRKSDTSYRRFAVKEEK